MELVISILCIFTLNTQPVRAQDTDEITWEADWDTLPDISVDPFQKPGVIFPGFTFYDTMHYLGLAWQANSIQEVVGLGCIKLGPLVYHLTGEENIKETCDHVLFSLKNGLPSDINSKCLVVWDEIEFGFNENSTFFELTQCYITNANTSNEGNVSTLLSAFEVMMGVYSSCEGYGLGTDRLSALVFGILDWLGPSILALVTQTDPYFIPYATCGTFRYFLSMEIYDVRKEVIKLASYPVGDVLEYLRDLQICSKLGSNVDHSEEFNFILDMLQALSRRSQSSLCSFFDGSLERSDFEAEAATIVNNIYSITEDEKICKDVMTILAGTDSITYLYYITGQDLSVSSNIDSLCDDIVTAITDGPSTEPETYTLPSNVTVNISQYDFFSVPGELLPGFVFNDALAFAGAVLSSGTVTEAGVLFCDVFEQFLVDSNVFERKEMEVRKICSLLRDNNLENIEKTCFEQMEILPHDYPLSLRLVDPLAVGENMGRKLLDAEAFSNIFVCRALDIFVHSNNNIRSIVSFALKDFIREGLPIGRDICENWSEIICYFKPHCSILDSSGVQLTSDQIEDQEIFDAILNDIEELLLTALGYSTRDTLCEDIIDGVAVFNGRAVDETVEMMVSKILQILDEPYLCTDLMNKATYMATDHFEVNLQDYMYQVTGLNDTLDTCKMVAENFPSYGLRSSKFSFLLTMVGLMLAICTKF